LLIESSPSLYRQACQTASTNRGVFLSATWGGMKEGYYLHIPARKESATINRAQNMVMFFVIINNAGE
jgi:hypothetical protein